jgi:hypothetical protein
MAWQTGGKKLRDRHRGLGAAGGDREVQQKTVSGYAKRAEALRPSNE